MSTSAPSPQTGGAPKNLAPATPKFIKGGSSEYIRDLLKKYSKNIDFYFGTALFLAIAYVKYFPLQIRYQANKLLGRLFLFALTVIVAIRYNWLFGLFMAIGSVLLLAVAPRTEGFQTTDFDVKLVTQKRKWFVEEVFEENPIAIEEDKVNTKAIQDNSGSNSTTSSR